jgi:hypothetical protein
MNPRRVFLLQFAAAYAHLDPVNIDAARALARQARERDALKRRALVLAAAAVLALNVGCACATSSQDQTCEVAQ